MPRPEPAVSNQRTSSGHSDASPSDVLSVSSASPASDAVPSPADGPARRAGKAPSKRALADREAIARGVWVDGEGAELPAGLALWWAIRKEDDKKLSRMVRAGVDLRDCSTEGEKSPQPALSVAVGLGSASVVSRLLRAGAQIDALDAEGKTALAIACQEGRGAAAQALIQAGADLSFLDAQGRSLLDLALLAKEELAVPWRAEDAALCAHELQQAWARIDRQALDGEACPAPKAPKRRV